MQATLRSATDVYAEALVRGGPLIARARGGLRVPLPVARWMAAADAIDGRVLQRARGPVLDIGCGPGRHLRWLGERGVAALGVDLSDAAVGLVRARGDRALVGSVFDRELLPVDRWRGALLLDGNIGIGGRPVALLRRCAALLAGDGELLVELDRPGVGVRCEALRLECAAGASDWFAWGRVGADALEPLARRAGLSPRERWVDHGRWFARLTPAGRAEPRR